MLNVLANDTRRGIVFFLRDRERTAGEIAEALARPRPSISHHLSALLESGLVELRSDGVFRRYSLNVTRVLAVWDDYLCEALGVDPRGSAP